MENDKPLLHHVFYIYHKIVHSLLTRSAGTLLITTSEGTFSQIYF